MQDDAIYGLLLAAGMIFMMFLPGLLFRPPSKEKHKEIVEAYLQNEIDKLD